MKKWDSEKEIGEWTENVRRANLKKQEPLWKQSLKEVADNPDYIFQEMDAIKDELKMDNPDPSYMKEKVRHINDWIDEIAKFHTAKGIAVRKVKRVI